jgi:mitochondrial fission protein ELM1
VFLRELLQRGHIRAQESQSLPFQSPPLRETARVAAAVRERLGR